MPRLIDADALLKSFDVAWMWEYDETGCGVRKKAVPTKTIEEAPTIDAEPVRHGRWVDRPTAIKYISHSECSTCGSWQGENWMNYCPHCGAKMDGGADNA